MQDFIVHAIYDACKHVPHEYLDYCSKSHWRPDNVDIAKLVLEGKSSYDICLKVSQCMPYVNRNEIESEHMQTNKNKIVNYQLCANKLKSICSKQLLIYKVRE